MTASQVSGPFVNSMRHQLLATTFSSVVGEDCGRISAGMSYLPSAHTVRLENACGFAKRGHHALPLILPKRLGQFTEPVHGEATASQV